MSNRGSPHTIEVWGEFACFTSPMKVERWSYPFITPSAARGIFDSIFVNRHEFRWEIERIEILTEPRYIALMRNEVKEKGPSESEVRRWMSEPSQIRPILADGDTFTTGDAGKGRTQRQTMALRDVRYKLTARIVRWPGAPKAMVAYEDQFKRRLERGQHFIHPSFGCREFPAWWGLPTDKPVWAEDVDAGWMLYDVFDLSRPGEATAKASISLFRARATKGIVQVPEYASDCVRKAVKL
ncbi:MAG TPA: CRISPR-associated protein Cas5 [Fimbriimonadaceae bacterium]|nr:CRISPR-associated protein Cas5 [Fimbriimonadaceae bacterium]